MKSNKKRMIGNRSAEAVGAVGKGVWFDVIVVRGMSGGATAL